MWNRCGALLAAMLVCACGSSGNDATVPAGVLYGPGPHWIDEVEGGRLTFTARAEVMVDVDGDDEADAALSVDGTTTVWRSGAFAGGPDPTHRDRIELEIVDMRLDGEGVRLRSGDGVGNGRSDGPLGSIGSSIERPADPRRADDLFRIFFEVDLGGGPLRNRAPLVVGSTIDHLPPLGSRFALIGPPVEMFAEGDIPTGIRVLAVDYEVLDRIE